MWITHDLFHTQVYLRPSLYLTFYAFSFRIESVSDLILRFLASKLHLDLCSVGLYVCTYPENHIFIFIFAKNGCLLCTERHCNSLLHSHWPYSPLHTPDTKSLPLPKIVFHLNFDDYHIKWWEESDVIYLGFINFFYITKT